MGPQRPHARRRDEVLKEKEGNRGIAGPKKCLRKNAVQAPVCPRGCAAAKGVESEPKRGLALKVAMPDCKIYV